MRKSLLVLALAALSVSACTKHEAQTPPGAAGASGAAQSGRVVNLAIWSNYVTPQVLADFEKKTGIHVQVSNYSSNEELLAKLQAGASGYDVAVPSDYMVFAMSKLGLLTPIDRTKVANSARVNPDLLKKSYDPENKFSLPFNWGTTGIAVNRSLYKGEVKGWHDVFDNPELAGKFSLLDDVRETIGAALKYNGFSLNSKNPAELEKAKQTLLRVRSKVKAFNSETKVPLINAEYPVAHSYSSDSLQARKATDGKIEYVLPSEGGTLWIDNLVIPQGAQHLAEAHELINFLIEPKEAAQIVETLFIAPANQDVLPLLPKEYASNASLFPSKKSLAKFEMIEDLGDTLSNWDRIWTEVKAESK